MTLKPSLFSLLLLVLFSVSISDSTTISTIESSSSSPSRLSEADCRVAGFDPWQLACSTCVLLKEYSFSAAASTTCRQCCQDYKDIARRIQKPYKVAVLLVSSSALLQGDGDSELSQFLREDWDALIQSKGSSRLLKVESKQDIASSSSSSNTADYNDMYRMMMMMMMRPPQAQLYFLSTTQIPQVLDEEHLQKAAAEVVSLDSAWKRDDIKDMLMTLLS